MSALLAVAGLVLVTQGPASAASVQPASARPASAITHRSGTPSPAAAGRRLPRVTGLGKGDDYKPVCGRPAKGHAACMALVRTNIRAHKGLVAADTTPSGYGPSDLQSAYNLPSATAGNGETVAVVDAGDDPTAESDLATYRAQYGLSACTTANGCFEKVNQEGQQGSYPPVDGTWPEEESLDLDMVSAICPNCHILLVEADSNDDSDLYAAEDEAVALGARFVSNSWSSSEYSTETQDDQYFNHPGVAITASAGDDGYRVGYPAASQYVTSVGGTTLTQDSSVPRGWEETVWGSSTGGEGTGSGCSAYEPKPSWQTDTGCANRTDNDVSAVANPNTGVAVYDGTDGGWLVVGGTSVASPLIAATYALAGTPVSTSYPASYPYADPSALNDVTSGSNGQCAPAYLCTAGPGYDGPTGLGTPDGTAAFSGGPHGEVTGTVTSAATGKPVAGATVSTDGGSTVANSTGRYELILPAGSYDVTASDFWDAEQTSDGVTVTQGTATTENFALSALPTATISGTVTDGSGHGWPLYAAVAVQGRPGSPAYTNPYTGAYHITVPQSASYTLTVTPDSSAVASATDPWSDAFEGNQPSGYQTATQQVTVGTGNITQDIAVPVDTGTCIAPGYGVRVSPGDGINEDFTGWSGSTPQDGWTVTGKKAGGPVWDFSNPGGRIPPPGGDADFAIVDAAAYGPGDANTSLVSPVINLSDVSRPVISFSSDFWNTFGSQAEAYVALSLNGGQTWRDVFSTDAILNTANKELAIPKAARQPDVRVRFRYVFKTVAGMHVFGTFWQLDNIAIGSPACQPLPGGLVAGVVRDASTGQPVSGAQVTGTGAVPTIGVTGATADPRLAGGFYEAFSSSTGRQRFTATDSRYQPQDKTVQVMTNEVTRANFTLQSAHLTVSQGPSGTIRMGRSMAKSLTISNTGSQPAQVSVGEQAGTTLTQSSSRNPGAAARMRGGGVTGAVAIRSSARAAGNPWAQVPPYADGLMLNVAAYDANDGKVYSVGGAAGAVSETGTVTSAGATGQGFAYVPTTRSWSPIPDMPVTVLAATGQFIGGKLYVSGGVGFSCLILNIFCSPVPEAVLQVYDPGTGMWGAQGGGPVGSVAFAASAVLDGQLYVVGGCSGATLSSSSNSYSRWECTGPGRDASRYDPATGAWTTVAPYPVKASSLACGGVAGELVCTGGLNATTGQTLSATYIYNPVTNTWSKGAKLPVGTWGMSSWTADGQLLISGGLTRESTTATREGFAYDPDSNTWTSIPATPVAHVQVGAACGYLIGSGVPVWSNSPFTPEKDAPMADEELPGYQQDCGSDGTQVPWLSVSPSQVTVPAGGSMTVTVTLNAAAADVTQPGTYTAGLTLTSDNPQVLPVVPVSMTVTPPKTWGEVTGTVTGTACTGGTGPLPGATVQVDSWAGDHTLTTNASGQYVLWLDKRSNPLTLIVTDDGWRSQTRTVRIRVGQVTTAKFTLTPQDCS